MLLVQVPARLSEREVRTWVERMERRMGARLEREALNQQEDLRKRADRLNKRHFGGRLLFESIEYVTNQRAKYGSCSPGSGRIRISHRLATMPSFVLDYLIVHELAHLLEPNHGKRFWELVKRYPMAERAIGYLMGAGLVAPRRSDDPEPSPWLPAEDDAPGDPWDGFLQGSMEWAGEA